MVLFLYKFIQKGSEPGDRRMQNGINTVSLNNITNGESKIALTAQR
jgi:hypothetical protein